MKVLVRMPTRGNPHFVASHAFRQAKLMNPSFDFGEVYCNKSAGIARSEIVNEAREKQADYVIMIDDDVTTPPCLQRLIDFDVPVVGWAIPTWHEGKIWLTAWEREGDEVHSLPPTKRGLIAVEGVGTGVICIRKDVLDITTYDPWFCYGVLQNGLQRHAEDSMFMINLHRAGIQPYCDTDFFADHTKATSLLQVARNTPEIFTQMIFSGDATLTEADAPLRA